MEVKIGVQHAPRELVIDTETSPGEVEKQVAEALEGSGEGVFAITDTKGRRVVVPAGKIAYVEIGTGPTGTVGFRS